MIDFSENTVEEAAAILLIDLPHYPSDIQGLEEEITETRLEIGEKRQIVARFSSRGSRLAPKYAHMLGLTSSYVGMKFTTEEEYRMYLFEYQLTLTTFTLLIIFKNRIEK